MDYQERYDSQFIELVDKAIRCKSLFRVDLQQLLDDWHKNRVIWIVLLWETVLAFLYLLKQLYQQLFIKWQCPEENAIKSHS